MAITWFALVAGALLSGAAVVAVMVARPTLEFPFAFVGLIAFASSMTSLFYIATGHGSSGATLWALAFVVAAAAGGYALASTLLYLLARRKPVEALPDVLPEDPGFPAVFVVSCTEPEFYDARVTARMLQSLADEGLLEASIGFLPFLFFAQKTRYRAVGGFNPARRQLESVAERLDVAMKGAHPRPSLCTGPESLDVLVAGAVRRGHRSVVVANLTVGESLALSAAKEALIDLRLSDRGVSVAHTETLSCSERITGMLAERVSRLATDYTTTGVVLAGHGQPDELASKNPRMDEDETTFLSRLRLALTDSGFVDANVRIAWADWGEPDVTSTIRHLTALGCTRVIVQPSTYPLDTIATRLDLEIAVKQARVQETATIVTLPAWRDDPAVIAELRSRVTSALAEMGEHN